MVVMEIVGKEREQGVSGAENSRIIWCEGVRWYGMT